MLNKMTTVDGTKQRGQEADERPEEFAYVGRKMPRSKMKCAKAGSPLGNPFKGEGSLEKYREWIKQQKHLHPLIKDLKGKCLLCWCGWDERVDLLDAGLFCHAQILARMAEGLDPME